MTADRAARRSRREDAATGAGCGDPGTVGAVSGESNGGGGAGLVLGRGGARGAYTSGALSVLLPELKDQVGTTTCTGPSATA